MTETANKKAVKITKVTYQWGMSEIRQHIFPQNSKSYLKIEAPHLKLILKLKPLNV